MTLKKTNCICCGHNGSFYPLDREHTKTRGSGGDDSESNVTIMCRRCHQMKNNKGIDWLANKFPTYKAWLLDKGWEFCDIKKKWFKPLE